MSDEIFFDFFFDYCFLASLIVFVSQVISFRFVSSLLNASFRRSCVLPFVFCCLICFSFCLSSFVFCFAFEGKRVEQSGKERKKNLTNHFLSSRFVSFGL